MAHEEEEEETYQNDHDEEQHNEKQQQQSSSSQSPSQQQSQSKQQLRSAKYIQVSSLEPQKVGFNLRVKVHDIKLIRNRTNLDGTKLRIAEALVGDETGCILLSLRNDQIEMIKPNDVIILRNGKIDMVKNGFMRVAIDRWGVIEHDSNQNSVKDIKLDNNLSLVEYELVREDQNQQQSNQQSNYNNQRQQRGGGQGQYNNQNRNRQRY
jgi:replication factor A1